MSDLDRVKQAQAARRKNLAEWRSKKRAELDLPSGLTVVVRKANIVDLAISGGIPETLTNDLMALANGPVEVDAQDLPKLAPIFDAVARACLVEPAIGETADDDHITLEELDFEDKIAIFQWTMEATNALKPFRANGKGDGVADGYAGEAVLAEAEHDPGDQG